MPNSYIDPIKHFQTNPSSKELPSFLIADEKFFFGVKGTVFRSYYYSIFYFQSGEAQFEVGSESYFVKAGDVAIVGPGLPYRWLNRKELTFDAIIFNSDVFRKGFDTSFINMLDYFCPDADKVMEMDKEQRHNFSTLLTTLKEVRFKDAAVPGILHAVLMLLQEYYHKLPQNKTISQSGKAEFVSTFRGLLAEHITNKKNVSFYASEMNITSKYLSEILMEETGWTAKKWIEYHLITEAKTMLSYSKLPIKEVSYQLGYQDASHFTKAFKKWTQLTPREFGIGV
ncbi:AraC-like DNA-binding protein [Algoriphagus sp. 4150]|uniref:helix-turn-helix domain-containing protein n=1 Tax=Algoriphagus sp. 4150 TaxID=2817756 RepID=UPI002865B384|nr:helix-turn-helix domain-containing protein [Algoriphagus sp. 4150]MDR7130277.1 AraC-like DNA-binding protein [Algoriphagus sp. 4150]